jgi:hypothetical protein
MKRLLAISCCLLTLACCQQQPRTTTATATDTTVTTPSAADTAAATAAPAADIAPDKLIAAGKSIGKTSLGTNADSLEKILGKPDFSDAAMGKAWLTWYSKRRDEHNNRNELNIFTAYKDSTMRTKTVQQIRVSSSFYITADSLRVYRSLGDIQRVYPDIVHEGSYKERDGRKIHVYDAIAQGIAFEVAEASEQRICTGIIVHEPGKRVTDIYLTLHPDLKK